MESDDEDDVVDRRKRPRTATDLIIEEALAEQKAQKQSHKGGSGGGGGAAVTKKKDGKTLKELEEEEGGPVRESLVGMAQTRRAMTRKSGNNKADLPDSTEVPTDVGKFEEAAQVEEEEGIKFTGFNLEEERETGYFDDEGNYVERKEDDPTVKDAWLASDGAKALSEEARAKIMARKAAEAEAAAAAEREAALSDRQIAALKQEVARNMQPGETLTKALKRLGASQSGQRAMSKRDKLRAAKSAGMDADGSTPRPDASVFLRMTEIADRLVADGEIDVFRETREDFERFAAMWLPKQPAASGATGRGPTELPSVGGAAPAAAAAVPAAAGTEEGDDGDMFADDDAVPAAPPAKPAPAPTFEAAVAPQPPSSAPSGPAPPTQDDTATDYASWPVKELKRFLQERGVDASSFVEKGDMVAKVKEVAAAGPASTGFTPPAGYAFDPSSGYFYSAQAGMYFDTTSGLFGSSGVWYAYDTATGQFVPVPG